MPCARVFCITEELQVEMFQRDFRFVAEYFVGIRKRKEGLIPEFHYPAERMKHVEAVMELMRALTNSKWFDKLPDHSKRKTENSAQRYFSKDAFRKKEEKSDQFLDGILRRVKEVKR
jgi:hypothetical protein